LEGLGVSARASFLAALKAAFPVASFLSFGASSTKSSLPLHTPKPFKGNMTVSQTIRALAERRLAIARKVYSALVARQPDRAFTLRDGQGRVLASSAPTPRQDDESSPPLSPS